MNIQDLLDPFQIYNDILNTAFPKTASDFFDELIKKSKIDVEGNKETVRKYKKALASAESLKNKLSSSRSLKGFLIFVIVLFFIVAIILFVVPVMNDYSEGRLTLDIFLGLLLIGIGGYFIYLITNKINVKIQNQEYEINKYTKEADDLLNKAYKEMAPLNCLFDWNAPSEILKKTSPIIELDPYFNRDRFQYFKEKYGFGDNTNKDSSTVMSQSGEIKGNPFFLYRTFNSKIIKKTYTGSLLISWTETYTDSEGNVRTEYRSEMLYASESHPAPIYYDATKLVYANDAAPNLHFSRKPSEATGLDEKSLERKVKKGEKVLHKQEMKEVMDKDGSTNFTMMGNSKFDVLFGATNRDNEVEFRLLFTPLAQTSMIKLITEGQPYGDDFSFIKNGQLNYIISNHSQGFDYSTSPSNYQSYSVDDSKTKFVSYNAHFVTSLYFDLAPLLCIPLYQQYKPFEYIYKKHLNYNYTSYEDEVMANFFNSDIFMPKGGNTSQILKVKNRMKVGDSDSISITSHAYHGVDRVSYKSVLGGDGHYHSVPVPWVEYFPVEKDTKIVVKKIDTTRSIFDDYINKNKALKDLLNRVGQDRIYQRKLFSFIQNGSYTEEDDKNIDEIFKK